MLRSILDTTTFKQSQITILGTIINGALGALFYIFLARFLGPSDFGLLTVSVATLTLLADILDFGTNTGLVRFVSSNIKNNFHQALKFLKLSLEIKLLSWVSILTLGFIFAPILAHQIFNKSELTSPLRLVSIGVGGALFFSFITSSLQSFQSFWTWSLINIAINFLRLAVILILIFYQSLSLTTGLVTYVTLPFFGFFFGLLILPTIAIVFEKDEFVVVRQFFSYNIWVAAFTVIAAISSRLDTFLTARLLTSFELGIYGAANQLVQVVPQIVGALGVVAAPKFASFRTNDQMLTYFKKFQVFVLGLAILGSLAIPLSYFVIPLLYGQEYVSTVRPFIILFLAMLVFLISVPLHQSIIFYFGKPDVFVWVTIGHLLIVGILGYILISNFGIIGAALTVLIGMLFNFIAPLFWFLHRLKR